MRSAAAEHIKNLKAANEKNLGIRVLAGSEVDILKDGSLDYSDEILAQLEVVVCSIHSYFNLERAAMTERMLAAIEKPIYSNYCPSPPGACCCAARSWTTDMEKILDACARYGGRHGVATPTPDRLDLKDVYLRMCKQRGVKKSSSPRIRTPLRIFPFHPPRRNSCPPRLARTERRHQYPADGAISRGPASPSQDPTGRTAKKAAKR